MGIETKLDTDRSFYVRTAEAIAQMPMLESWIFSDRRVVLHKSKNGNYAVSDYLTGLQISEHKHKTTVQKLAEQQLARVIELESSGTFRWSAHPEINTPEFIQGWNDAMSFEGRYLDGILLALSSRRLH